MSTALIIGGDHVDVIKKTLNEIGINRTAHWTGRKPGDHHKKIPKSTRLIVLVTGFINHSFTYHIKKVASKRNIQIVYTGTNGSQLHSKLAVLTDAINTDCRKTYDLILRLFLYRLPTQ